ncbi:MAG: efflux RND transporter periplasmic adaptor subunit [candidate division NC10 bacterium]|nr:efflux RND transporter periplasmic adaptor subunit [candidate division NC10 bacterium]
MWFKKKRSIVLGIALLLLVGGVFLFSRFWAGSESIQYRTVKIERGTITSSIFASGTVNPVITVDVGSQVTGMIKELYADFNTQVKRGRLIARIDPATFEAKLQQAKADLESAKASVIHQRAAVERAEAQVANARAAVEASKANLVKAEVAVRDARIKFESRSALFKEGGISQEERDSARATHDAAIAQWEASKAQLEAAQASWRSAQAELQVAQAELKAAEASVKQKEAAVWQAQVDLDHTFIRAPVDGVVISRSVDVGQTVAASLQAPTLFIIAQDLTRMQVKTSVDEADISKVHEGQEATFTVDAYPSETFRGRIHQIRKAPVVQQNVVTYDVIIRVENPDLKLMPGMTANVELLVARKENVLKLPNAALRFKPNLSLQGERGGQALAQPAKERLQKVVWILGENRGPRPVWVKLGISDQQFTEAVEGELKEGQEVIVGTSSKEKGSQSSFLLGQPPRRTPPF